MADEDGEDVPEPQGRAFWSGTISFGLVSIPVDILSAVRPRRVSLRTLGPDGLPLARHYVCSEDGRALDAEDIVRGYELDEGRFVVVTDEELRALEPRKSRDIDLRRFVARDQIDPFLLERPYILAPSGESTKAYHLLARTMEQSGRAGIATFVMRDKEYLAAIYSEGGLLRLVTLRFLDEVRSPEDVGLPEARVARPKRRHELEEALRGLEQGALDPEPLRDIDGNKMLELAERKRRESRDVVAVPEELRVEVEPTEKVVEIMQLLKHRLGASRVPAAARPVETSRKELYERAKALHIPGRSGMSKEELAAAIREAG